jgi:hypothetical protein
MRSKLSLAAERSMWVWGCQGPNGGFRGEVPKGCVPWTVIMGEGAGVERPRRPWHRSGQDTLYRSVEANRGTKSAYVDRDLMPAQERWDQEVLPGSQLSM